MKGFITRIINWNKARYSQEYNQDLQIKLLTEEVNELVLSITDVDRLDALVDIVYIAIGAMWKMGLTNEQIYAAIHIVCDSNDTKVALKTFSHIKANINKGPDFIPPETRLQELLDERRS